MGPAAEALVTPLSRAGRDAALSKAKELELIYSQADMDARIRVEVAKAVKEVKLEERAREAVGLVMNAVPVGPAPGEDFDRWALLSEAEVAVNGFMGGEDDDASSGGGGREDGEGDMDSAHPAEQEQHQGGMRRRDHLRKLRNLCAGRGYLDPDALARDPAMCLVLCEAIVEFHIVEALVEVIHEFDSDVHNEAILCMASVASLVTHLPPNEGKPYEGMLKRKVTSEYVLDAVVVASAYPSLNDAEGQAALMHMLLALDATDKLPVKVWEIVVAHALGTHCPMAEFPQLAWLADAVMLNICIRRAREKGRTSLRSSMRYSAMLATVPFFTWIKANLSMEGCLQLMSLGEGGRRMVGIVCCSQTGIMDLGQHQDTQTTEVTNLLTALERVDKEVIGWQRFLLNALEKERRDADERLDVSKNLFTRAMQKAMSEKLKELGLQEALAANADASNGQGTPETPALAGSELSAVTSDPKRNWNLMRQATRLALGRESRVNLIETIESLKIENAALANELMIARRDIRMFEKRR